MRVGLIADTHGLLRAEVLDAFAGVEHILHAGDVGSTDVSSTWTLPGSGSAYVGTGAYKGQVRVLVHTQRWTAPSPTAFSTWGNLMKIVYDAP